ncbi:MAG: hypothetical protein EOO64_03510 [Massilia sp.]|nr:MAG: hypothetical protein EOO64_03510 [Massilia sp.]
MQGIEPLDLVPLWVLLISIVLMVLLSVEGGYRLGRLRARQTHEMEMPVGEMVASTLGLLAFILGFTFGLAASRFDAKRQLLVDEANAIGTTYLRAEMLPEGRDGIQVLLREYVDVRLEAIKPDKLARSIRRSEELQRKLWDLTVPIAKNNPDSIVVGLFVQSLNEAIDLHTKRLTAALRNRIPFAIWAALYGISVFSFAAMGYHSGLTGTSRSLVIIFVACAFSVVIVLIADLDRSQEGMLTVSPQALIDLRQSMT